MILAILIAMIVCFVITWIVIGANSSPFPQPIEDNHSYCKERMRQLEQEVIYWKGETRRNELFVRPRYHECLCPLFHPTENFEKKYYAVDKERQDLVDIITKGKKSAEDLTKNLSL